MQKCDSTHVKLHDKKQLTHALSNVTAIGPLIRYVMCLADRNFVFVVNCLCLSSVQNEVFLSDRRTPLFKRNVKPRLYQCVPKWPLGTVITKILNETRFTRKTLPRVFTRVHSNESAKFDVQTRIVENQQIKWVSRLTCGSCEKIVLGHSA